MRRFLILALLALSLSSCSQNNSDAGGVATAETLTTPEVVEETGDAPTTTGEAVSTTTTVPTTTTTTPPSTTANSDVPGGREDTLGYTTLAAGHSFFGPVAQHFEQFVVKAGLVEHTQSLVFEGGSAGAAEALWNNDGRRQEMQDHLATGEVDLLVLTHHPQYPGPDGYRNWIVEAIGHNPDTMIAITIPWSLNPTEMDSASYAEQWQVRFDELETGLLSGLRAEFPDTEIRTLPYGRVAVEAYLAFEAGELEVVGELISTGGETGRVGLFRDTLGHPGLFLTEAASYFWFRLLYGDATNATPQEIDSDHIRIVDLALANAWP